MRTLGNALLFELVGRAAPRDMAVLILGETGVGKELIAETLHERSPRAHRRFFALNCAALPENLIERGAARQVWQRRVSSHQRARGACASAAGATERGRPLARLFLQ